MSLNRKDDPNPQTLSEGQQGILDELKRSVPMTSEAYPDDWLHCTIHLNPKTGEMHSDGDHRVRHWIQEHINDPAPRRQ